MSPSSRAACFFSFSGSSAIGFLEFPMGYHGTLYPNPTPEGPGQ
jgi:hypothetical protein